MSLAPRSLSGQIALVLTAALLVASAVNFGFLLNERRQSAMVEASGPAITRFADYVQQIAAGQTPNPRQLQDRGPGFSRFRFASENPLLKRNLDRHRRLELRLARALDDAGVEVLSVQASSRLLNENDIRREIARVRGQEGVPPPSSDRIDGPDSRERPSGPSGPMRRFNAGDVREIVLAVELTDGRWLMSEAFAPGPPRREIVQVAISTLVLFGCVLAAALWVTSRLSRPLADLNAAAQQVGASGEPQQVAVRGPADVRATIESFNAMSERVTQLLNEKDIMLGALGHDLRTPLTSLRIRLETMEPAEDREKAVATIEETTALLQTILDLARQGRSSEPVQLLDMASFSSSMADDYAETGADVRFAGPSVVAEIAGRPVMLRRLFRNLIDNALAYGGAATLGVSQDGFWAVVTVEDEGPGMTPEDIDAARKPFVRGESSRNRQTGGAGLGLALADAIAKAHGGRLDIVNRSPKGLRVSVRLPLASGRPSGDVAI